jgi:hypothetical protein
MEWIEALRGTVAGLDTAPVIYFIEENPTYLPFVRPFFEAVDRGEFRVATSVLTLTEVLVHPLRQEDHALAERYRGILLHASQVTVVPVSEPSPKRRRNYAHATVYEHRTLFRLPLRSAHEHPRF